MREGKYKTNVKPPYLECKDCGYRDPYYYFIHGMWWWKKTYCPKCGSKELDHNPKRPNVMPVPLGSNIKLIR